MNEKLEENLELKEEIDIFKQETENKNLKISELEN